MKTVSESRWRLFESSLRARGNRKPWEGRFTSDTLVLQVTVRWVINTRQQMLKPPKDERCIHELWETGVFASLCVVTVEGTITPPVEGGLCAISFTPSADFRIMMLLMMMMGVKTSLNAPWLVLMDRSPDLLMLPLSHQWVFISESVLNSTDRLWDGRV